MTPKEAKKELLFYKDSTPMTILRDFLSIEIDKIDESLKSKCQNILTTEEDKLPKLKNSLKLEEAERNKLNWLLNEYLGGPNE